MTDILISNNKLTVIIPFLNEGEEVGNTLNSIRQTIGNNVDILIINDASTDKNGYRLVAQKYNATYIKNKKRLGVAASRDKGIALIKTPYFLLMDAHMRFYQKDWADVIVSELDQNDRVLLCCDTKVLYKDNDGIIYESNSASAFGATINLDGNKWILNNEWSTVEKEPKTPVEDIACVLGAGYAASKRYWQYLRGLEGLIYYGSDETYISLKVWLEGGKCRLLKNIRIGHIYRAHAPYKIDSADMVFNKLWIAELLLPFSYKIRTFGALYLENPLKFIEAFQLLRKKRKQVETLKQYYHQIFTTDFNRILYLNKKRIPENKELQKKKQEKLNDLYKKLLLNCNTLPCEGLWHGRMGCILFLAKYNHTHLKDLHIELIEDLIGDVYKKIENTNLSIDFEEGICGIAYGLAWLLNQQIMEGDLTEVLKEVDQRIMERDPLRITDYTLQTGLSGILYYVLYRLQIAQEQNLAIPFDTEYLYRLYRYSLKAVKDPEKIACFEMASWFVAYMKDRTLKLEIPDITQILNIKTLKEKTINSFTLGLEEGLAGLGLSILSE